MTKVKYKNDKWCTVVAINGQHEILMPTGVRIPAIISTVVEDVFEEIPTVIVKMHVNIGDYTETVMTRPKEIDLIEQVEKLKEDCQVRDMFLRKYEKELRDIKETWWFKLFRFIGCSPYSMPF